jgi:hypothetical protein
MEACSGAHFVGSGTVDSSSLEASGVTDADLNNWGAKWGTPAIFVSLVEWADHVITE